MTRRVSLVVTMRVLSSCCDYESLVVTMRGCPGNDVCSTNENEKDGINENENDVRLI